MSDKSPLPQNPDLIILTFILEPRDDPFSTLAITHSLTSPRQQAFLKMRIPFFRRRHG